MGQEASQLGRRTHKDRVWLSTGESQYVSVDKTVLDTWFPNGSGEKQQLGGSHPAADVEAELVIRRNGEWNGGGGCRVAGATVSLIAMLVEGTGVAKIRSLSGSRDFRTLRDIIPSLHAVST